MVPPTAATFIFTDLSEACTCTKTNRGKTNFSGTFSASFPDFLGTFSEPSPKPVWTWPSREPSPGWAWPGSALKPATPSPEPSPKPSPEPSRPGFGPKPSPALHQSLPDLLWDLLKEPCWTWPGSAPKGKNKLQRNHRWNYTLATTLSSDSMTTNRERVCSQTVAKNDAFAFRIWWQRALYCLASLPCIACRIPFWSSTIWGSRQSRFEPVPRDRCSLHFSSFLSCHCHLRKSIRLIAHRKGLRA